MEAMPVDQALEMQPLRTEEYCWGKKHVLIETPKLFLDLLIIKKGGYSSAHFHKNLNNLLIVLSGKIYINLYKSEIKLNFIRYEELIPFTQYRIFPYNIHQFRAIEYSEVLEISANETDLEILRSDIIRLNERGIENDT